MKTIVVGGGAAGMIAAYYAAITGSETVLIEKNEKLGKKIYITGKGRCNITNNCSPQEFLSNVVSNSKFLTSAIFGFQPQDMVDLLECNGLPVKTERGNRVFPVSDKSSDVIKTLANMCKFAGVQILLNEAVERILTEEGSVVGVETELGSYRADKVVLATGGISYPSTGSTGDGYRFAKSLGHKIVPAVQALVPFKIKGDYCARLSGLSLKNVSLNTYVGGKLFSSQFGEMLFTHQGVSGPIVLTTSSLINRVDKKNLTMCVDLKPALDFETLDNRLLRDFDELKNRTLKNSLDKLLPSGLIPIIIERTGIPENKRNNEITRAERQRIVQVVKNFTLDFDCLAPFTEAVVTAGGVSVGEINPKTMESKLVKGLFFAGEIIDVDAFTGGYNLQIAFSTGVKAGTCENY
ncbi:MAG: NAD(P)/FAD-dependent oxidoreductase [Clostridia bacterium]|nr:NAD(P)/FAD-dependent oxidoreductase [Clostridia bacterium]